MGSSDWDTVEDSRGTVERLKSGWIRLLLVMAVATCAVLFSARLIEIPSQSALRGWDNSFYLFWVRSAVIDGDLDFANEIDETNTLASKYVPLAKELPLTETGRVPNKYGIGWALSALPWFMAADATVAIANSTGITSMPRDGFGPVYQVYLQFGQLVYALVGLFALFKWLSLYFDRSDSKLGVVLLWLSSPLLYYQSTNLSMSHSLVFTLVSALLLLCATLPGSKRPLLKVATIGCLAGLCLVTRYQAFPFLLLPFVLFVKSLFEGNKESRVKLATALPLGVVAFLIPITLQVLAWKAV